MNKVSIAILLSTIYLIVYVLLIQLNMLESVVLIMFATSPLIVLLLAYIIIAKGKYEGGNLQDDSHWGYEDKTS
jgi:hypothetical protein